MTGSREKHPNWKGGRYLNKGYVMVLIENGKYRKEHRIVMEAHLGRSLERSEKVHHKNEDRADNRIENLEIHTAGSHTKHHWDTGALREAHIQRPMSTCHPERKHYAKGLCRLCYMVKAQLKYAKANRDKIREYRKKRYRELKAMGLSRLEIRSRL